MSTARSELERALATLSPVMDVVREREAELAPPQWSEARGWTEFLDALPDASVAKCEAVGLAAALPFIAAAPPSLTALARAVAASVSGVPSLEDRAALSVETHVKARKRPQLAALLAAVSPMAAAASRIVDVGAGTGHLSRIASLRFDAEVLGLDRDARRVEAARALAGNAPARFELRDARENSLGLGPGDLAVGLHACGGLGDRMVTECAEAGASLALVSCCLQKIDGAARAPLSAPGARAGFVVPRSVLGLSNVSARTAGVEASVSENLAAREVRWALASLLRARGLAVGPAEAMRGINRRRAHEGLAQIARRACAMRGLVAPERDELDAHAAWAARAFSRARRWALPRTMLAPLLELAVVLDRAAALEDRGFRVRVARAFGDDVSPRNLTVLAETSASW